MDNQRKEEGNTNQSNSRDRRNINKSKSDPQGIQKNGKDVKAKKTRKTRKELNKEEIEAIKEHTENTYGTLLYCK